MKKVFLEVFPVFCMCHCAVKSWELFRVGEKAFRTSSPATRSDSISSDYSLASYRSPSMVGAAIVEVDDCVAFDFDDAATPQTPSLVDWLIVNLGMMRMAWRRIRYHLRSLKDYHTIFEYSRCHVRLRREWVAWLNAVVLIVADVDYYDSDADDSTADGLDGVSVLPREAMYENWLALTCCDDDMNAIRGIVSPKIELHVIKM